MSRYHEALVLASAKNVDEKGEPPKSNEKRTTRRQRPSRSSTYTTPTMSTMEVLTMPIAAPIGHRRAPKLSESAGGTGTRKG